MTIEQIINHYKLDSLGVEIEDPNGNYIIKQDAEIWLNYVKGDIVFQDYSLDNYTINIVIEKGLKYGLIRRKIVFN